MPLNAATEVNNNASTLIGEGSQTTLTLLLLSNVDLCPRYTVNCSQ